MATHQLPASSGNRARADDTAGGTKTVGALLRAARDARGLTLDQIARETKIPRRHLEALERDDLDALPAGLYLRGEIRAYAKTVHLDETIPLARLERELEAMDPPPPPVEQSPARAPLVSRQQALIGIGLIALTALAGYAFGKRGSPAEGPPLPAVIETAPALSVQPVSLAPSTAVGTSLKAAGERAPLGFQDAAPAALTSPPRDALPPAQPVAQDLATRLVVTTEPPGARVTVNGIGWGTTPVTIRHLPPGDKRIRVSQDGYVAAERVVTLAEGQQRRVSISMSQTP